MFEFLRTQILPPRCLICGADSSVNLGVCNTCRSKIMPLPKPTCDVCGKPIGIKGVCLDCQFNRPPYDKVISSAIFDGILPDIIHAFKYNRATVYKRFLSRLLYESIIDLDMSVDIVTFVPLHWTRMIQRGYNQSALIARELSSFMGIDVRYDVIKKIKKTKSQVGLTRAERKSNLRGTFSASNVINKSVMVIDDVITTGHTAIEISRTLKEAKASHVVFLSVGRVI